MGWASLSTGHSQRASSASAAEDICDLLRLLPMLLGRERLPDGVIEMVVQLPKRLDCHLFDIAAGRLRSVELGSMMPWSRVAGGPGEWIEALRPAGRIRGLEIYGDRQLALQMLAALPRFP